MALNFPTPAQAALQSPVNTFSPFSTPLANTTNGVTYYYDPALNQWSTAGGSSGSGTVTEILTGTGITGGPIVNTGTISLLPANTLSIGGVSQIGKSIAIDPSGQIDLTGTFETSLLPDVDIAYDLGSPTQRWRSLYLNNDDGLYLGAYKINVVGGYLAVDGISETGVVQIIAGTGLTGGTITSTGTIALANTSVTPGSYVSANITVDAQGRITAAAPGAGGGSVTSISGSGGTTGLTLNGGPITSSGTLTLGGTLAVANGGTGASTASGAQANLLPAQATHANQFLKTDGAGVLSWGATVSSVDVSGGTTGLTFSGGPVTSSGTITMAGTLALANGGTGATDQAGAQANLLPAQAGNAGKVLSTNGTGTISWVNSSSGTVTSVGITGTSGIGVVSGSPVTTSGSITLAIDIATLPALP
jgi:hypothetical protein